MFSNWKIIAFAISLLIGLYAWHVIKTDILEKQQVAALAAQKTQLTYQCEKDKAVTQEANNAFIKSCQTTANQCAAALSVPAKCIPIVQPSKRTKLAPAQSRHDNTVGLTSQWLKAYESECKAIQRDYNTCVAFGHACATGE